MIFDANDAVFQLRRWVTIARHNTDTSQAGQRERDAAALFAALDHHILTGNLPPLAWNLMPQLTKNEADTLGRAAFYANPDHPRGLAWSDLLDAGRERWESFINDVLQAYATARHIAVIPLFHVVNGDGDPS